MCATLEPYSPLTSLKIYEKIMYCALSTKFLEFVLQFMKYSLKTSEELTKRYFIRE